ncbi:MAG: sulfotransferase [Pseudomonadota bacterium]|nr:sulfotransferase [Pseudomonadota bacterium]
MTPNRPEVLNRVFVVGCPRSGTTLVQAMTSAHPRVFSLPETFFFTRAFPRRWITRHLSWPSIRVRNHFEQYLRDIGRSDLASRYRIKIFQRNYCRPFVSVMDHLASDELSPIWLEKTPGHLFCIDEITKCIPSAKFIHVMRNGLDVVNSLYKATNIDSDKYAKFRRYKFLRGKFRGLTVPECVEQWNNALRVVTDYYGQNNHITVWYERLTTNPAPELQGLCRFLDLDFDDNMLNPSLSFHKIVRPDEPWKANNAKRLLRKNAPGNSDSSALSKEDKRLVEKTLLPVPARLLTD